MVNGHHLGIAYKLEIKKSSGIYSPVSHLVRRPENKNHANPLVDPARDASFTFPPSQPPR